MSGNANNLLNPPPGESVHKEHSIDVVSFYFDFVNHPAEPQVSDMFEV